jgi:hypothetical protein
MPPDTSKMKPEIAMASMLIFNMSLSMGVMSFFVSRPVVRLSLSYSFWIDHLIRVFQHHGLPPADLSLRQAGFLFNHLTTWSFDNFIHIY